MVKDTSIKLPAELAGKAVDLGKIVLPKSANRRSRGGSPVIEATRTIPQGNGCELLVVLTIYVKTEKTEPQQQEERIVWM